MSAKTSSTASGVLHFPTVTQELCITPRAGASLVQASDPLTSSEQSETGNQHHNTDTLSLSVSGLLNPLGSAVTGSHRRLVFRPVHENGRVRMQSILSPDVHYNSVNSLTRKL